MGRLLPSWALLLVALASPPAAASRLQDRRPAGGRHGVRPAITLSHLTTHETFVLRPDARGRLGGKQLKGFRRFLRCHHTGREHPMAPQLAQLLYATAHHFDDRPISVVAGYRAPRVAREKGNPRSPHKRGVACDFRVEGVAVPELRDYLRRAFHGVGVGYYPVSGFVHLDVGRRKDAFWIDYSGPGERARYTPEPPPADEVDDEAEGSAALPPPPSEASVAAPAREDRGVAAGPRGGSERTPLE